MFENLYLLTDFDETSIAHFMERGEILNSRVSRFLQTNYL